MSPFKKKVECSFKYGYFSYTKASLHFRRPLELSGILFMMDGCTCLGSKSHSPFTAIIKLGRARTFFFL